MKAALYLRVSSDRQTVENQRRELYELARQRGVLDGCRSFEEVESATKRRPVLEELLDQVRRRKVRTLFVWSLDRLHRNLRQLVDLVLELDHLGCQLVSAREPWLDQPGPVRPLLISIFGWVAQYEREHLVERVKAGLDRARAQGKRLGRPPTSPLAIGAAVRRVRQGETAQAAAQAASVSDSALRRELLRQGFKPPRRGRGLGPHTWLPPKTPAPGRAAGARISRR